MAPPIGHQKTTEEWEETYLKLLLLYTDRVGFVRSFLVPSFPVQKDMPTLPGVLSFAGGLMLTIFLYFLSSWKTIIDDPKDFGGFLSAVIIGNVVLVPVCMAIFVGGWVWEVQRPGRSILLMKMARMAPPRRDHSKPLAFTWYRDLIKHSIYGACVATWGFSTANTGDPFSSFQLALILLVLEGPMHNINESFWTSPAIPDAEVCITAGMQGQCLFAEGASNSIAVNLNALAQLKWDEKAQTIKEEVKKAAQSDTTYSFSIFDIATGYHMTITKDKSTRIHEGQQNMAKLVMQELFNNRDQFMA